MKTIFIFLIAFFLGLAIQATVVHSIIPSAIAPDFLIILVLYLAFHYKSVGGVVGAFVIGLGADLASGRFLGPNAAGAVVGFLIAVAISNRVYAERGASVALLALLISLAKTITALFMLALYTRVSVLTWQVTSVMFLEALFTALVAPFVVRLLGRVQAQSYVTSSALLSR